MTDGTFIAPAAFEAKFHQFQRSVFRLETLQVYRGSGEDDAIAAFNAGASTPPPDPEQDAWEEMIRAHRRGGRAMQRVHVVVEPLTAYMRFELTWAYAPNAAAGEDIRIIPTTAASWPAGLPHLDFWLFDSAEMFDALYDAAGLWLGLAPVAAPARIAQACRWRDTALRLGRLWADYVQARPDLLDRLPPKWRPDELARAR